MKTQSTIRDAVRYVLWREGEPMKRADVQKGVETLLGHGVSSSSITSSLRLQAQNDNSPVRCTARGIYEYALPFHKFGNSRLYNGDSLELLKDFPPNSINAVVTDPPYGLVEYEKKELSKLRRGHGGIWRIPPSLDGYTRSPLPRFTTLTDADKEQLSLFFIQVGQELHRIVVPGANVAVASNPLVCHIVTDALVKAGFEPRGQIIRLVQTMRGGDRPKGSEAEFHDVSVMPRSQWEPWVIVRKRFDGTASRNLTEWGTGGWRRLSDDQPFGDVIKSSPTHASEKAIAPHPSLKPQKFMRELVRGSLPLGRGIVLDPFAGSGSTLAAAEALGYESIGIERDLEYYRLAINAIPKLKELKPDWACRGY